MFPIPWNFPFRKKNGDLSTISDVINSGGGGGSDLPPHDIGDAGKLLGVDSAGKLEWTDDVSSEIQTLANYANAQSNPNLLDNPWFTVNQRGQNQYSISDSTDAPLTLDRWFIFVNNAGTLTVDKVDGGINLTVSNDALSNWQFAQRIDLDLFGKKVTFSIDVGGTIYSATGIIPAKTASWQTACIGNAGGITFDIAVVPNTITHYNLLASIRPPKDGNTYNIRSVKLELGEVSTLASDTAPNYAMELTKCQRYYQCYKLKSNYAQLDNGRFNNDHEILMPLSLPTALRAQPTVSVTNLSSLSVYSDTNDTISTITLGTSIYNSDDVVKVCLVVTTAGTNHTKGDTALIAGTGDVATAQPVIALSADL